MSIQLITNKHRVSWKENTGSFPRISTQVAVIPDSSFAVRSTSGVSISWYVKIGHISACGAESQELLLYRS